MTALERRISRFNSSAEPVQRKEVSREQSPKKVTEKEEATHTSTFKRKQLTQLQNDIEKYLQQSSEEEVVDLPFSPEEDKKHRRADLGSSVIILGQSGATNSAGELNAEDLVSKNLEVLKVEMICERSSFIDDSAANTTYGQ